jgi:hypothetical protein
VTANHEWEVDAPETLGNVRFLTTVEVDMSRTRFDKRMELVERRVGEQEPVRHDVLRPVVEVVQPGSEVALGRFRTILQPEFKRVSVRTPSKNIECGTTSGNRHSES